MPIHVYVFILSLLTLYVSGCATNKIDLLKVDAISLQTISSEQARISNVAVHQHDEIMEIEISVRPQEHQIRFVSGQVAVSIRDPNGNTFDFILKQGKKGHHDLGSKMQHSHFWVRFPYIPSPGTVIKVSHIGNSDEEKP